MNITITDHANCKKQVRLEIPSDVVRAQTDKTAADLARKVHIPGFRPGHVPTSVIKSRFRKELRSEVASKLLPDAFQDATREKSLRVVGQPTMDEFNFGDDESLIATFTIEVAPDFDLTGYKGIQLNKRVYKIRDEDVEGELSQLREHHAEMAPVEDRGAQTGDIVTVNLTGSYIEATEEAEGKAEESSEEKTQEINETDVEIPLGEEGVLKQFADALAGAQTGEAREFRIDYPGDFPNSELAGRKASYRAEVTAVRIKELPELDDEFARNVGEKFKTINDLRADIRTAIEQQAEIATRQGLEKSALDSLLNRYRFDVPLGVVEAQMNSKLKNFLQRLDFDRLKVDPNQLDIAKMREPFRPEAEREVRVSFILDRIAEAEGIEVGDEELDKEVTRMAEYSGQTFTALKARLTRDEALDSIKLQIKSRKALDLVIASADIQTEEVEGFGEGNPQTEQKDETAQE
jgi:trigger factor